MAHDHTESCPQIQSVVVILVQKKVDDSIIFSIDDNCGVDWRWIFLRHRKYRVTGTHEQQAILHFVDVDEMAFRVFQSTLETGPIEFGITNLRTSKTVLRHTERKTEHTPTVFPE